MIYYYGCSSFGKNWARGVRVTGGGIFRARLRPEGYVSVDAGTLTTPALRIAANDLYVNSAGPVRIAVVDGAGHEIAAARLEDDRLVHLVQFNGASLKSLATQGVVRLSFTVDPGGRLYAFSVR